MFVSVAVPKKSPSKKRRSAATVTAAPDHRIALACCLDRSADLLLSLGNHLAAERLAMRAQMLRGTEL